MYQDRAAGSGYPVPTTRALFSSAVSLLLLCLVFVCCSAIRDEAKRSQRNQRPHCAPASLCLVLCCLPLPFPLSHMRGHVVACFVLFTLRFESLSPGKVKTVNEKLVAVFLTKVKLPSFVCSPHVPNICLAIVCTHV